MFGSISKANPNTTVTANFVADEACTISLSGYPIRVNGTAATSPITLAVNDKIEVDVTSPAALNYSFVDYQYNGKASQFAVVSGSGGTRPLLKRIYRNKYWTDFSPTQAHNASIKDKNTSSIQSIIFSSYLNALNEDAVAIIDPSGGSIAFHVQTSASQTALKANFTATTYPISYTFLYNGGTQGNDIYVLGKDGLVTKLSNTMVKTASTVAPNTNLKCIFNDGATLWAAGAGRLTNFTDLNTAVNYTTTDTYVEGVGAAGNLYLVTNDGRLVMFSNGTFTTLYTTTMLGTPCIYQNHIVVPSPEEYKLLYFNLDGSLASSLDTGNYLPFACGTDGTQMAVASCSSPDVMVFTGSTKTIVTFPKNVNSATPLDGYLVADHYLNEFATTYPPDPPITGVNFNTMKGPINVDTGSMEFTISSVGDDLRVATSALAVATANKVKKGNIIQNGQTISMTTRSVDGRKSVPLVIGSYAFDYQVWGQESAAFSIQMNDQISNKLASGTPTWTLTVPDQVVSAPIALSYGSMTINGQPFTGSQTVKKGDALVITLNLPTGATQYYSVLSIADSQYGLVVNNAGDQATDFQTFQDFDKTDLTSTFTVSETGIYDLPDYTNASATVNGVATTFPATLNANDTVVLTHVMTSSYRYDERDTVLMGPNINYICTSRTLVFDVPTPSLDFGYIHLGIPDFPSTADGVATIAGLSPNWFSDLSSENCQFSVNGGPWSDTAHVENGDQVQLQYTVLNLWDGTRPVQVFSLAVNGPVDCGIFHIDPPLGINFDPGHQDTTLEATSGEWMRIEPSTISASAPLVEYIAFAERTSIASMSTFFDNTVWATPSATSEFSRDGEASGVQPVSKFTSGNAPASTVAPTSKFQFSPENISTPLPLANFYPKNYRSVVLNSRFPIKYDEYLEVDIDQVNESAFGHSVQPIEITPQYINDAGVAGPGVPAQFDHNSDNESQAVQTRWGMVPWFSEAYWQGIPVYENLIFHMVDLSALQNSPFYFAWDVPLYVDTSYGKFTENTSLVATETVFYSNVLIPVKITSYWDNAHLAQAPMSVPARAQPAYVDTPSYMAVAVDSALWETLLPDLTGGYDTEAEAETAGEKLSGNLTIQTYQQPEGTFSYVINYETSLVCPINQNISIIKAWYMGGG